MENKVKHILYHVGRDLVIGDIKYSPWEGLLNLSLDSISIFDKVGKYFPV
jgi:hypothetical protein